MNDQLKLVMDRRCRSLILVVLLGALGLCPMLHAQSDIPPLMGDLPIIGGGGGDFFRESCPNGAFTTGLLLHAGDDVDAVQLLCQSAGGRRSPDVPWHGGSGGSLKVLLCPRANPAVLGLFILAEGVNSQIVNNVHLFCGLETTGQPLDGHPDAVFDGPRNVANWNGSFSGVIQSRESCPHGKIATGLIGRAGLFLDAMGLYCGPSAGLPAPAPAPPPASRAPVKAIGRIPVHPSVSLEPHQSICDSAAAARARNSPATALLDTQCRAEIATREATDLTAGPSGGPISVCDAAQAALNRLAPEAADLAAKCRADGGGQTLRTESQQLAAKGRSMTEADPLIAELSKRQPIGPFRRGFDIGVAATGADQLWGPGKQRILDSLTATEGEGFKIASSFAMDRNRNAQLAATGASIAAADAAVAQARTADADVRCWLGFDIASAIFGDPAMGAQGNRATGPGSMKIRDGLSAPAQKGFNESVQYHLARTY